MKTKNKKAVSTLIETVLLILIVVAAISMIWGLVVPMMQDKITEIVQSCISAKIKINTVEGYTCYDPEDMQLKVMVSRGADDLKFAGLQIIATALDGSYRFDIVDNIPLQNEDRIYTLNMTAAPQQVSVAPVLKVGNSNKVCSITSRANVNLCI